MKWKRCKNCDELIAGYYTFCQECTWKIKNGYLKTEGDEGKTKHKVNILEGSRNKRGGFVAANKPK